MNVILIYFVFMHIIILLYSYQLVSSMIWPRTSSSRKVDRKSTGWGLLGRTICGPDGSLNVSGVGAVSVSVSVSVICHGIVLETKFLFWLQYLYCYLKKGANFMTIRCTKILFTPFAYLHLHPDFHWDWCRNLLHAGTLNIGLCKNPRTDLTTPSFKQYELFM